MWASFEMNIKQILKENNYTLKSFAIDIGLSRPTLDSYILMYESGDTIPKERYQIIFDGLFKDSIDIDDFTKRINKYKRLLERDQNLGTTSLYVGDADLVSRIHRLMLADIKCEDCDRNMYLFIGQLISNYKEVAIFKQLADYFVVLNNLADGNDSGIDKRYLAYFYKMMSAIKDKEPDFDSENYDNFMKRREEIKEEKLKRRNKKVSEIESLVKEITDEYAKNGMELTKEQLLKELASRG